MHLPEFQHPQYELSPVRNAIDIHAAGAAMANELGEFHVTPVPVPHDCTDGFLGAYWRRPHIYLDSLARSSMSSFARIDAGDGLRRLASDLDSGVWHKRNAELLDLEALDVGYRLLRCDRNPTPSQAGAC